MSGRQNKVLLIGYGNPGRLDDGLGPALAEALASLDLPGVTVESNYQLNIEDAAQAADFDVVIFADAHLNCPGAFVFEKIEPVAEVTFTTHSIEPPSLLALTRDTFGVNPLGFCLGIRGYEFNNFGEWLSEGARHNLQRALDFIVPLLKKAEPSQLINACLEFSQNDTLSCNGDLKCKMESM